MVISKLKLGTGFSFAFFFLHPRQNNNEIIKNIFNFIQFKISTLIIKSKHNKIISLKTVLTVLLLFFTINLTNCSLFKPNQQPDTVEAALAQRNRHKRRTLRRARRENKKQIKAYWDRQTPEVRKKVKNSYKREKRNAKRKAKIKKKADKERARSGEWK